MEEEGVYPIYLITKIILKKILNENDKLKIEFGGVCVAFRKFCII